MNKDEIRKDMMKKRTNIVNKDDIDEVIKRKLKGSSFYKSSKNIFIYVGFKSEINTIEFIKEFLEEGKRVYIPRTDVKSRIMEAVEITSLSNLERSNYGILEPKKDKRAINKSELDLIIFPGLAFDKKGYRIGYGAGYYDKFTKGLNDKILKVALCYDFQMIDKIPYEAHDAKVDYIITEKREVKII